MSSAPEKHTSPEKPRVPTSLKWVVKLVDKLPQATPGKREKAVAQWLKMSRSVQEEALPILKELAKEQPPRGRLALAAFIARVTASDEQGQAFLRFGKRLEEAKILTLFSVEGETGTHDTVWSQLFGSVGQDESILWHVLLDVIVTPYLLRPDFQRSRWGILHGFHGKEVAKCFTQVFEAHTQSRVQALAKNVDAPATDDLGASLRRALFVAPAKQSQALVDADRKIAFAQHFDSVERLAPDVKLVENAALKVFGVDNLQDLLSWCRDRGHDERVLSVTRGLPPKQVEEAIRAYTDAGSATPTEVPLTHPDSDEIMRANNPDSVPQSPETSSGAERERSQEDGQRLLEPRRTSEDQTPSPTSSPSSRVQEVTARLATVEALAAVLRAERSIKPKSLLSSATAAYVKQVRQELGGTLKHLDPLFDRGESEELQTGLGALSAKLREEVSSLEAAAPLPEVLVGFQTVPKSAFWDHIAVAVESVLAGDRLLLLDGNRAVAVFETRKRKKGEEQFTPSQLKRSPGPSLRKVSARHALFVKGTQVALAPIPKPVTAVPSEVLSRVPRWRTDLQEETSAKRRARIDAETNKKDRERMLSRADATRTPEELERLKRLRNSRK